MSLQALLKPLKHKSCHDVAMTGAGAIVAVFEATIDERF